MEKFSAYRDPGTGIQPFLNPVPPLGEDALVKIALPVRYLCSIVRTALILALVVLYMVVVQGLCLVLLPILPLHRVVTHLMTFIIGRSVLFLLGLLWIPVEHITRKRGRLATAEESWNPRSGDIIVSNWVSWIEVVWLALRFNPVFVLPITEDAVPTPSISSVASSPLTHTPGRRTGTGSANIQSPKKSLQVRIPVIGFRQVSLLTMVGLTGHVPPFGASKSGSRVENLEDIRKKAVGPIVVFPECTTSNGRGLLRFSDVFNRNIPIKNYQVFVMCVRYDPPTALAPTMTLPIPSHIFNPLFHLFNLATSLSPLKISIRLLAPSESPSSQLFMASEILSGSGEDQLTESCGSLIAQIGKLKRTGMGWEDKASFLEFYRGKKK